MYLRFSTPAGASANYCVWALVVLIFSPQRFGLPCCSTELSLFALLNSLNTWQDAMFAIHAMWGSPMFVIAVLVLLWFEVGWATFVGLGVMLVMVPFTGGMQLGFGTRRTQRT